MRRKEFYKFKKEAMRYCVQERKLFRQNNKNVPIRRVVDDDKKRQEIMKNYMMRVVTREEGGLS